MRSSRAQAAIEFLMTYGWAALIILVVMGMLFYLGVFNPSTSAASSCVLPSGFTCVEYRLDDNGNLYLDVGQATGRTITVTGVGCSASGNPSLTDYPSVQIRNGGHAVVTGAGVPCLNATGLSFKGKVVIQYTVAGSALTRNITATVTAPLSGTGTGTGYGGDLVLMLHLDNNSAIGENATFFIDSSPYKSNGSCTMCPTFTAGRQGGAYSFHGGTIQGANSSSLQITGDLSVVAWILPNTSANDFMPIVTKQYEAEWHFGVDVRGATLGIAWRHGNGSVETKNFDNVLTEGDVWYHLACVRTASPKALTCYKNGVSLGSLAYTTTPVTGVNAYQVGAGYSAYKFQGTIDEVRVYNRALSAAEVLALYQTGG